MSDLRQVYEKIAGRYERANLVITLGNVDKWRREAVGLFNSRKRHLKILDAGAGPGNMARHFNGVKYVVALDFAIEMLKINNVADEKVVGVFEHMPFRGGSFDVVAAGYSLHAASDLERVVAEFSRVADYHVVVSIGKPDGELARWLLTLYTKYVVPILTCLVAGAYGEYRAIYNIMKSQPKNSEIRKVIERHAVLLAFRERGLGSVYMYVAKSIKRDTPRL